MGPCTYHGASPCPVPPFPENVTPGGLHVPFISSVCRSIPRGKRHQQPREGERASHQGGPEDDGSDRCGAHRVLDLPLRSSFLLRLCIIGALLHQPIQKQVTQWKGDL